MLQIIYSYGSYHDYQSQYVMTIDDKLQKNADVCKNFQVMRYKLPASVYVAPIRIHRGWISYFIANICGSGNRFAWNVLGGRLMSKKIKRWWQQYFLPLICKISPRKVHSYLYIQTHKNTSFPIINWDNPRTHDEKIHWLMVNRYINPEFGFYADKIRVREYVKKCGFEDMLIPIYEVHGNINDFDSSKVPKSFVLKTNHGSGLRFYEFIKDKKNHAFLDFGLKKMKKAMKVDYSKLSFEHHYSYIKPLVYAEHLLSDGNERLNDYKIYVFHGKAKFVLVCTERNEDGEPLLNTYSLDWQELDFIHKDLRGHLVNKPQSFEYMLKAAEKLGEPFAVARIDFYEVAGKPYFGEITLTPAAGNALYFTDDAQIKIDEMIDLKLLEDYNFANKSHV